MKNLESLLQRFKRSLGKDVLLKETVTERLRSVINTDIPSEDINIKEDILEISISSGAKKNEINLREKEILADINQISGTRLSRIRYK